MESIRRDLYHGLFLWQSAADGPPRLTRPAPAPTEVPDPVTGRLLRIATVETSDQTICPLCAQHGVGGFVSFVADLRLAYACPQCRELVWLPGL
jgi:hypothetical protein